MTRNLATHLTYAMQPVLIGSVLIALGYGLPWQGLDWILPALLVVVSLWSVVRFVGIQSGVLTPMPWFLLTYSLYFGFGSTAHHFAPAEVRDYVDAFFPLTAQWVRKTNVLNAVGLAVICTVFQAVVSWRKLEVPTLRVDRTDFVSKRMMWGCLVLGYVARIIIRADDPTGVGGGGIIKNVENLTLVAITLLGYLVARGHRKYLPILIAAAATDAWLAFAMLMKSNVLSVGLALFLGVFWARPSRRLLVGAIAAGVGFYLALTPIVELGRLLRWRSDVSISNRDLILTAWRATDQSTAVSSLPGAYAWTRMMYGSAEAFAMDQFDRGYPGDTYRMIPALFIPRALWPDKPTISPGVTFNVLATGNPVSASSPGALGEAYWNGGWTYVLISAAYVALLFGVFTRLILPPLQAGDARWLPGAALMVTIGVRPDNWLVASYIGAVPVLVVLLFIPLWIVPAHSSRRTSAVAPSSGGT